MKKIYTDYFQKSKVFLYPLLGIKKGIRFVPIETYIKWDHPHLPENILVCSYAVNRDTTNEEEIKLGYKSVHEWFQGGGYDKEDNFVDVLSKGLKEVLIDQEEN